MKAFLLVFLGGGLGSLLRYIIALQTNTVKSGFPLGTFIVNIVGSLIIGIILGYALKNNTVSQNLILLIATGFCGGFTTFSTFAFENFMFLKEGDFLSFGLYTFGSIAIGLLAVFVGLLLVRYL